jgi:hypothetical protein
MEEAEYFDHVIDLMVERAERTPGQVYRVGNLVNIPGLTLKEMLGNMDVVLSGLRPYLRLLGLPRFPLQPNQFQRSPRLHRVLMGITLRDWTELLLPIERT